MSQRLPLCCGRVFTWCSMLERARFWGPGDVDFVKRIDLRTKLVDCVHFSGKPTKTALCQPILGVAINLGSKTSLAFAMVDLY